MKKNSPFEWFTEMKLNGEPWSNSNSIAGEEVVIRYLFGKYDDFKSMGKKIQNSIFLLFVVENLMLFSCKNSYEN